MSEPIYSAIEKLEQELQRQNRWRAYIEELTTLVALQLSFTDCDDSDLVLWSILRIPNHERIAAASRVLGVSWVKTDRG